MTTLQIQDLVIEYASGGYAVRPVDGLSLEVHDGELALLLGASGCGKTTLLSAMAAILTPKSGSLRFGDTDVIGLSGAPLTAYRREKVGLVFQAFHLIPSLTALENVAVPLITAGTRTRAAKARAAQLLEQVGLGDRIDHRPGDLSGGQQQRVAIARALVHDPPLILADEPTAHLDFIQVEAVIDILRKLARPGRLVIVSTHDERLLPLADRVLELTPRKAARRLPPQRRELSDGEVVFDQGDEAEVIWVVEQGRIEIYRILVDGGEEPVAVVEASHYFGEIAPMFGLRRSASARSLGPAVVVGYSPTDFRERFQPAGASGPAETSVVSAADLAADAAP